jgi:D-3-phosphoglycerate dehydrogenase
MPYLVVVPDSLNQAGLEVLRASEEIELHAPGKMTRDETLAAIPPAHALIVRSDTRVNTELLDQATNLKIVVRAGVGVDNIDLDECTRRGVVVMNAPDGNTISTAEHAFALILALARRIPQAHASLGQGRWDRKQYVGTEVRGKTLGLIGFGRVGRAVAQRASAFGMKEIAYDPFVPAHVARHLGLSLVPTLDELLAEADVISLHALITSDTKEMINAANIARMKDGVLLVNTARGKLIHNGDLADAIRSGKVGGAALDVYDVEPPDPNNPLLNLDNVIHTPHLGANTREAQAAVARQAAEQVLEGLLNGKYTNVRNKAILDEA